MEPTSRIGADRIDKQPKFMEYARSVQGA